MRARARSCAVASERRCVGVDRRCRESEGKAKIEGYMSVSDEEAHQREGSRMQAKRRLSLESQDGHP